MRSYFFGLSLVWVAILAELLNVLGVLVVALVSLWIPFGAGIAIGELEVRRIRRELAIFRSDQPQVAHVV